MKPSARRVGLIVVTSTVIGMILGYIVILPTVVSHMSDRAPDRLGHAFNDVKAKAGDAGISNAFPVNKAKAGQ